MKQGQFEGWYFKQQCGGHAVAFIPARHRDQNGVETASIQIITEEKAWNVAIAADEFFIKRKPFTVVAGNSVFGLDGCYIDCQTDDTVFCGALQYHRVVHPSYDIMGPFCCVPAMQCRHSLVSLHHRVDGSLSIGEAKLDFIDGIGYIEGDRGSSFPKRYLWTQCGAAGVSVMISVADIPYLGGRFTGCISTVFVNGQEHRLATYLGARPERIGQREVVLRQGVYRLQAVLEEDRFLSLRAPRQGGMERTVREGLCCRVHYRLEKGNKVLLELSSNQASFEAEWGAK